MLQLLRRSRTTTVHLTDFLPGGNPSMKPLCGAKDGRQTVVNVPAGATCCRRCERMDRAMW